MGCSGIHMHMLLDSSKAEFLEVEIWPFSWVEISDFYTWRILMVFYRDRLELSRYRYSYSKQSHEL